MKKLKTGLKKQKGFFTKIDFSHQGSKTQRENAPHFFYFVPLSLGGYPFFAAKQ
jgi:hypothetical protein